MMVGAGGILLFVALVAAPFAWAFWRSPRHGKFLTPLSGGHWHPVQFRPGPPPLPEHDDAPFLHGAVGARG